MWVKCTSIGMSTNLSTEENSHETFPVSDNSIAAIDAGLSNSIGHGTANFHACANGYAPANTHAAAYGNRNTEAHVHTGQNGDRSRQSTAAAQTVLDELDELLGDTDIPYQNGHLEWQQEKPLMVSLKGPSWDYVEVDDDLVGKNFILKTDVTWEASGIIICSAIFRSEPNLEQGKQYKFSYLRLSGLPAWEIDVFEYGRPQNSPTKTQFSDAIDLHNRATNQVVLVARDEQFNLYINGVHQGRYFDYSKQRMEGVFGFSADQDSGEGSCNYENSWVWTLE